MEGDVADHIVGLAADGADGKTVAARAVHVVNGDVGARGDGDAVILVVDGAVGEQDVVSAGEIETVRVVSSGISVRSRVCGVASAVVQEDVGEGQSVATGNVEAVDWPVLDVEVAED